MQDNREDIEVELSDHEFMQIAKMAHERDVTFNRMVEIILQEQIEKMRADTANNS